MPDLAHSLQSRDLGHLNIVAELWGVELETADPKLALQRLVPALLEPELFDEIVETLAVMARSALDDLLQNEGRLPWSQFIRRYGDVREMGSAKRDRELPHLTPSSPAEILWYRALVARAFLDTPTGPQEFAYIPDDFLAVLTTSLDTTIPPLGRQATPTERAYILPATDHILDHACTLLAALRLGLPVVSREFQVAAWQASHPEAPNPDTLRALLIEAEIVNPQNNLPYPETTQRFLELPRGNALTQLTQTWMHSQQFNELLLLPGLHAEGEWQNDPLSTRYTLLDFLSSIPCQIWWSLPAFVTGIKESQPDYQRPAGDYDSWYLRDATTGEFLRGFEHWDDVDGALIRFIISGPLHWFGILDLAKPSKEAPLTAFRFSSWSHDLLSGDPPPGVDVEAESLLVSSNALLRVPRLVSRATRYQVARFCTWEGEKYEAYAYRITPTSLSRARQQGLQVSHLRKLLQLHALAVPPSLIKALERWEKHGSEARIEKTMILRLRSPKLLKILLDSRAARFLGDQLGPTVIIVKPGAWEKVLAILAELGYLGEGISDESW